MTTQPEALRLADAISKAIRPEASLPVGDWARAAAELRRLHEVNAELVASLKSLVAAVDKAGFATEFQRQLSKADYTIAKATGEQQ